MNPNLRNMAHLRPNIYIYINYLYSTYRYKYFVFDITFADRVKLGMPVRNISEENGVITVETEKGQVFKVWYTDF